MNGHHGPRPMSKEEEDEEEEGGGAAAVPVRELRELHSVCMQTVVVVTGALWARAEAAGLLSSSSSPSSPSSSSLQQQHQHRHQQQQKKKKLPADVKGAWALVMELGLSLANNGEGTNGGWDGGRGSHASLYGLGGYS